MPINVLRIPDKLEDFHFTPVASLVDPADNAPVDALTTPVFNFASEAMSVTEFIDPEPPAFEISPEASSFENFSNLTNSLNAKVARRSRGFFRLDPDKTIILLTMSRGQKLAGKTVSGALLAHEQIHWDIFFLVAKAAARALDELRTSGRDSLDRQAIAIVKNRLEHSPHAPSVADRLQGAYDRETNHGKDRLWQAIWAADMVAALSQTAPTAIGARAL